MTKIFSIRFPAFSSGNRKSAIENRKWLGLSVIAFVLVVYGAVAQAQQTEAKVPPSPVRGEISLSNSEQQPLPNQHSINSGPS